MEKEKEKSLVHTKPMNPLKYQWLPLNSPVFQFMFHALGLTTNPPRSSVPCGNDRGGPVFQAEPLSRPGTMKLTSGEPLTEKPDSMKKIGIKLMATVSLIITAALAATPLAGYATPEVVAWGNNGSGQTDIPSGLTNVVAIAAGTNHSLIRSHAKR